MSDIGFAGVDFSFLNDPAFQASLVPDANGNLPGMPDYVAPTGDGSVPAPVKDPAVVAAEIAATKSKLDREAATAARDADRASRQQDARATIAKVLSDFGLGDLAEYTYLNIIAKDITNPDAIIYQLREQPAYQKRFAGNAARVKAGLAELDPGTYIGLEDAFRATMRSNGLLPGFYDESSYFQKLIEGDVSPQELQSRISDGYNAVAQASPEVKRQMQEIYGVSENGLAAYFIDPDKALPVLKRQAQAVRVAAAGKELGGIQLTGGLAEDIVSRGLSESAVQAGFTEVGKLGELGTQMAGETAITQEQQVGAALGYDVQAQKDLEARKRRRVAEYAGGGGFARTTGQTSGGAQLSVGQAQ